VSARGGGVSAGEVRDPFSPEADPGREEVEGDVVEKDAVRFGRRTLIVVTAVLPAVTAVGCTHPRPACPTLAQDEQRCRHRFCRYHGGD
jgi:hypothetical protein